MLVRLLWLWIGFAAALSICGIITLPALLIAGAFTALAVALAAALSPPEAPKPPVASK